MKSVKKLLYQMPLLQLCVVYVVFFVAPKLAPGALAGAAGGMAVDRAMNYVPMPNY